MPEQVTAEDGTTYTNYLADNPEFTRAEKARLLKKASQYGSGGIAAFEADEAAAQARRSDMLGYASEQAEPMLGGVQAYDDRVVGVNTARDTSGQAYNQAMKEMAAASGAWFDRHQGQGALDFAALGLGSGGGGGGRGGGGRGGGGGGRGGGGGGGGRVFDPVNYTLEQAAQNVGLSGWTGGQPTGKELLFGQADNGEGTQDDGLPGGDMRAKGAFENVEEARAAGLEGDELLSFIIDTAEETDMSEDMKAAYIASLADYYGLESMSAQEVATLLYGDSVNMDTSIYTDLGFMYQNDIDSQRLLGRAGRNPDGSKTYAQSVLDQKGAIRRLDDELRGVQGQRDKQRRPLAERMKDVMDNPNRREGRDDVFQRLEAEVQRPQREQDQGGGQGGPGRGSKGMTENAARIAAQRERKKKEARLRALEMSADANTNRAFY